MHRKCKENRPFVFHKKKGWERALHIERLCHNALSKDRICFFKKQNKTQLITIDAVECTTE
jgi:hypothetical protein